MPIIYGFANLGGTYKSPRIRRNPQPRSTVMPGPPSLIKTAVADTVRRKLEGQAPARIELRV